MTTVTYELRGNIEGLSESAEITAEADINLHILYDSRDCFSAWIAVKPSGSSDLVKYPFISSVTNPTISIPNGASFKVVGSMQPGARLITTLVY